MSENRTVNCPKCSKEHPNPHDVAEETPVPVWCLYCGARLIKPPFDFRGLSEPLVARTNS